MSRRSRAATVNDPGLFFDSRLTTCLGCLPCADFRVCGGLKIAAPVFDCTRFCKCSSDEQRSRCDIPCHLNHPMYVARRREVGGWDLKAKRCPETSTPALGPFVPLVKDGSCRQSSLDVEVVALPLARLFNHKTGRIKFTNRDELLEQFKIGTQARLLLDAIGFDQPLEHYWGIGRAAGLPAMIAALKPDLVTVPNFSLFTDLPRPEDLRNMKRIVICWEELASQGLATALHLNGRTDQDWLRWRTFIKDHPEIKVVAFEFTSGSASPERAPWYARHLISLCTALQRELTLVVRGARGFLPHFAQVFKQVVYVSADPFINTIKGRKRLQWEPSTRPKWTANHTPKGEPLDSLLAHNITTMSQLIAHRLSQPPNPTAFTRPVASNGKGKSERTELPQVAPDQKTLFDGLDEPA